MSRRLSKKYNNIRRHFRNRCIERIGFPLSESDLRKKIQSNSLEFVRKTSNTRTVFRYKNPLTNKDYYIVYDKSRHLVVTIYEVKFNKNKVSK